MKEKRKGVGSYFKLEFKTQLKIAVLAALGFIIALSWRDFIVSMLNVIVTKLDVVDQLYLYQLFSAILITFIAVLIMVLLSSAHSASNEDDEPE